MTAVNKVAVVPSNAEVFDQIEAAALMKSDVEGAGEVMLVTKVVDEDGHVDVLIVFPTHVDTAADDKLAVGERHQPTAIRFTLNTFLNAARMLAVQHTDVVGQAPSDYEEAEPGRIIVPGELGHG